MLKLVDIYDMDEDVAATILYELLKERDPKVNISHKRLPSFHEHRGFVDTRPYLDWWLLEKDGDYVGSMYLTDKNEIGIFIFKEHQGKGYGTIALELLREEHEGPFLANVAPENEQSQRFFDKNGFELIQFTFKEKQEQ